MDHAQLPLSLPLLLVHRLPPAHKEAELLIGGKNPALDPIPKLPAAPETYARWRTGSGALTARNFLFFIFCIPEGEAAAWRSWCTGEAGKKKGTSHICPAPCALLLGEPSRAASVPSLPSPPHRAYVRRYLYLCCDSPDAASPRKKKASLL